MILVIYLGPCSSLLSGLGSSRIRGPFLVVPLDKGCSGSGSIFGPRISGNHQMGDDLGSDE